MTPLVEARQLVKSLGGRRVVDGVEVECHRGQRRGLLGRATGTKPLRRPSRRLLGE